MVSKTDKTSKSTTQPDVIRISSSAVDTMNLGGISGIASLSQLARPME